MPTSSQIANLIIQNTLPLDSVKEVLSRHNASAMWPIILKKLEHELRLISPVNVLEIATDLPTETLSQIKSRIYNDKEDVKVVLNPKLLAGFKASLGYKSIDASALRIIKQIKN